MLVLDRKRANAKILTVVGVMRFKAERAKSVYLIPSLAHGFKEASSKQKRAYPLDRQSDITIPFQVAIFTDSDKRLQQRVIGPLSTGRGDRRLIALAITHLTTLRIKSSPA